VSGDTIEGTRLESTKYLFATSIDINNNETYETYHSCGGFLKWWYPTTIGFPTQNDHFGVFWGYHYFWKHLCRCCKKWAQGDWTATDTETATRKWTACLILGTCCLVLSPFGFCRWCSALSVDLGCLWDVSNRCTPKIQTCLDESYNSTVCKHHLQITTGQCQFLRWSVTSVYMPVASSKISISKYPPGRCIICNPSKGRTKKRRPKNI